MSLKQKSEAALLKVIENAGLFAGARYGSDQSQASTLQLPCVSAVYTPMGDRPSSGGQRTGQEAGLLTLVVRSTADKQKDEDPDPVVAHAANVDNVRQSVVVADLKGALNAAAVQPYACLALRPGRPPMIKAPDRAFQDIFTWEINHVEVNCA